MRTLGRLILALRLRLGRAPAPTVDRPRVARGERELCAGTARLGAPAAPPATLSPDEAGRLLGIPVRILGR